MNERILLPYPYRRLTHRVYRLARQHAAVWWLTLPLWAPRWLFFTWRRHEARTPARGGRPITDYLWSVDGDGPH